MRKTPLLLALMGLLTALPLHAAPQQESLGDLARQQREQRQKEGKKATKLFTNDDLPSHPPENMTAKEPVTTTSVDAEKPNPNLPTTSQKKDSESQSPESKMQTKDYWQARFLQARRDLAHAKEQQQLAEDELNLLQIQAAREIDPNAKQTLATKVQAKQSDVEVLTAATAVAQTNLDDLEQEFKASGAPDDWRPAS